MRESHSGIYAFIGGLGIIMFWYGVWEGLQYVPLLGTPLVAMLVGFSLMYGTGLLVFEMIGDYEALKPEDEQYQYKNYSVKREEIAVQYKVLDDEELVEDFFS